MSRIKLSISMPTRNRAAFIAQALESVISQADDSVEIVIVDGASTDNTGSVVESFRRRFANIVYHRAQTNGGVNRDMAKAIELASGEYCWMLSDDDALKPGAVKRIMAETASCCDLYLCNVTVCSLKMQPIRDRQWLHASVPGRVFALHDPAQFQEYCRHANSIGALFSYMSAIVLRRESWLKKGYDLAFDGTAYALASTLFSLLASSCRLQYIKEPLVFWRNDNTSFQFEGGLVKRFLLDFDGYLQLADTYIANPDSRREFLAVMRREHPWYTIVHVTSYIRDPWEWNDFRNKLTAFGYSPGLAGLCFFLGRQSALVRWGVVLKRRFVKSPLLHRIKRMLVKTC